MRVYPKSASPSAAEGVKHLVRLPAWRGGGISHWGLTDGKAYVLKDTEILCRKVYIPALKVTEMWPVADLEEFFDEEA